LPRYHFPFSNFPHFIRTEILLFLPRAWKKFAFEENFPFLFPSSVHFFALISPKLQLLSTFLTFQATRSSVKYVKFSGPEEHVPGRATVDNLLRNASGIRAFSFSKVKRSTSPFFIFQYGKWGLRGKIGGFSRKRGKGT